MDETIQPQPQRRRSSILLRRSIATLPVPAVEDSSSETNVLESKPPDSMDQENVDVNHLNRCLNNLTSEHLAWQSLRAERKLLKNSENRISVPPQLSWDAAQEFLSKEDIAFLKNGPTLNDIYANYDGLVVEAARLHTKYKRTSNLIASIQRLAKSRLHSIKINIAEYSENNLDLPIASIKS